MKPVIGLLLVLAACFWAACVIPARSSDKRATGVWSPSHRTVHQTDRPSDVTPATDGRAQVGTDNGWRRTAQGWEQRAHWRMPGHARVGAPEYAEIPIVSVHPVVVALLQLLISLGALLAFEPPAVQNGRQSASSSGAR